MLLRMALFFLNYPVRISQKSCRATPQMPDGCDVKRERAQAWNGYAVVRGKHPRAKGKLGDILAFAREAVNGPKIEHLSLCVIDGKERLPDVWYDDNFEECEAV